MPRLTPSRSITLIAGALACGGPATIPLDATEGPRPALVAPSTGALVPMVRVAKAVGWKSDATPTPAPGLVVTAFARDLDHPRWLHVLPNGDVLVAESAAPAGPKPKGIRAWAFSQVMKYAGSAVPSADRITLLRDADGDGVAETRSVFLQGLRSPIGMALVGDALYVANTDAILRFPYTAGQMQLTARGAQVIALPAGPINYHWTKTLLASPDGSRLYVTVGSNSNAGERGFEVEAGRAAIWVVDLRDGTHRVLASGLRNPVGMTWVAMPGTAAPALWVAVNERDEIGSDLVPDYMTAVKDGGFYGWPYSYFGAHVDERVKPQRPDLVARAIVPDYALGAHTASLGLAYSGGSALAPRFGEGVFIGQHGSWNRYPPSGYRVVFVPFRDGSPAGQPVEVLGGFRSDTLAYGRPVGVALDDRAGLLVADDVGNAVWRVSVRR